MPMPSNMPTAKNATMKTERTHEENQERAYIAASRRSDRSLEARVESARRASEIHKRRTGRALRVTEQDVLNEEMYEEEEDDLPLPYRQLTQHLTTGSAEFNRRLAAYLTNHVAVRSALDQIIRESHNLSATAAAAGNAGFYPMTGDPSMQQQTAFSPTMFQPSFSSNLPFTPDQSNPSTPMMHHPGPQISTAQLQTPSTQFHIGPLGLSTVPQPNYGGGQFIRRQTAPQLQIPHGVNANVYQSLSPSQLQSLNQNHALHRLDGEFQPSPSSDTVMLSPQTAPMPTTPSATNVSSPEMLHSRRMSMPAKVSASPVQIQRPKLPASSQTSGLAANAPATVSSAKVKKSPSQVDNGKPASTKATVQSPTLKRKAADELSHEPVVKAAKQSDGRTSSKNTPSQVDLGPLDLSLSQNAQELLFGGLNMTGMNPPQMTNNKPMKLDDSFKDMKNFNLSLPRATATPPATQYSSDSAQANFDATFFGNLHSMAPFSDGDYDLSSLMMETGGNTFGTMFSKMEPLDTGSVDDLWQDFFTSDNMTNSQEPVSSQDAQASPNA